MCNACLPTPSQLEKTDAFADQLLSMLNQGALSLMVSIGHRTGLFDTLAELPPADIDRIASHSGLNRRYCKEWLAAMVTGGIVDYQPDRSEYHLPAYRAALLTRNAAPDNIAVFAQYVGMLGQVEDRVVDCFREGGGVAYEHYPRFQEIMAEDSGQTVLAALEEHILPLAEGLPERLEQGIRVLDVGCGKGRALLQLAVRYPRSEFVGYDISREAVDKAQARAEALGLDNLSFECRDLTGFDKQVERGDFDLVTAFDAIHDQADPQAVLNGIQHSLRAGGTFLMQDIRASSQLENNVEHPIAPLLYTLSTMHCMTVSLAQGGAGLGTMWGEELALSMLQTAGFERISVKQLEHDFQNSFYIMRKPDRQGAVH